MKKRILCLALTIILCLGIVPTSALAYSTPDFSDVPSTHWAYGAVMRMADKGIIQGTGNREFSPNSTATAEQFITLVGRVLFPDIKVEGADWSGPYVTEAKAKGMLTGTTITNENLKSAISRYDMAVVLRGASRVLGLKETLAKADEIADYGITPTMYADAVRAVFGSGLIKGDDNHCFNGQNSMRRSELAVVMDRLLKLQGEVETAQREIVPTYTLNVNVPTDGVMVVGEANLVSGYPDPSTAAPYDDYGGLNRTSLLTCTSSDPSVVQITGSDKRSWFVTAVGLGTATITITDPNGVSGAKDITVVSAREGLGTKTYEVLVTTARQERHSFRGNAYTENDFFPNTPYKIYYTRDGGKTSQVVYEGVAPSDGGLARIELELPEDSFYSKDAGLYVSGEAMLNGQRLVTSDLRTDGRAYARIVKNVRAMSESNSSASRLEFLLTPPNGEKAKFAITGVVGYGGNQGPTVGAGFTVCLYLKDGTLVGTAQTDANGEFSMECEVDEIDNGFDVNTEQYYVTASGIQDGVKMKFDGKRKNGELILWSLDFIGGNPYNPSGMPIGVE